MWRSVALVNESMTMARTSDSGRCVGCVWPAAAFWFLKYICRTPPSTGHRAMADSQVDNGRKSGTNRDVRYHRPPQALNMGRTDLVVQERLHERLRGAGRAACLALI